MKKEEENNGTERLVPLSNLLVDLLNDERISREIRIEYVAKLQKVANWIPLLSLNYIIENYPNTIMAQKHK